MSFLNPLAFVFLAFIPVVILFYLLKRRRVSKLVSSTLLWQKFLAESQASAPFQKLRKNWLLILQLILLCFVILGMARPFVSGETKSASLRVVILDASASMQARDESPSRFERARAEALRWADGLKDNDHMVIVEAGTITEVKQSATSDKAALKRALAACRPSDGPTRLVPALRMAESLVREQRDAEIHLFSDGAAGDLDEFSNKALPLIYHRVGNSSENLGITAVDVRANPENPAQRAIYVAVGNFSSNQAQAVLELRLDDRQIESRPLTLAPGEVAPQVFRSDQERDGIFHVRLDSTDQLAVDNQAVVSSLLPRPPRVLLVSRGNRLLERALRSIPRLQLTVAPSLTDTARSFDFVVLDDVEPVTWPECNVLAIRVAQTNWLPGIRAMELPGIVDWRSSHPLLRYVSFDNVQVRQTLTAPAPDWAVPLVEAPQAPMILAGELGRQRIIWIGFDLLDSTWPLRVSFPIFVANAADWLNPNTSRGQQFQVKAGEAFRFPLLQPESIARVTMPDGSVRTTPIGGNAAEFVFADTRQTGVYRLKIGTNDAVFCVNLLDNAESHIAPRNELQLGAYTSVPATTERKTNRELWRLLAALAFVMLLFEWWYYHRRTV